MKATPNAYADFRAQALRAKHLSAWTRIHYYFRIWKWEITDSKTHEWKAK